MKSNLLLIIKLTPLYYLEISSTYIKMAKSAFTESILPTQSKSVGLVNVINKDVTGARLLPTTVSTSAVD